MNKKKTLKIILRKCECIVESFKGPIFDPQPAPNCECIPPELLHSGVTFKIRLPHLQNAAQTSKVHPHFVHLQKL